MGEKEIQKVMRNERRRWVFFEILETGNQGSWAYRILKKLDYRYPTVQRSINELEEVGAIELKKIAVVAGRTRKYYIATPAGRDAFEVETKRSFDHYRRLVYKYAKKAEKDVVTLEAPDLLRAVLKQLKKEGEREVSHEDRRSS